MSTMSTLTITDAVGAVVDLQLRDDTAISKSKTTRLLDQSKTLVTALLKPVDQCGISKVSVGAQISEPSLLLANAYQLTVNNTSSGSVIVRTAADKLLFPDDGFSPSIPIASNQAWVGFEIDASIAAKLSATVNGIGVALAASTTQKLTSYSLFEAAPPPLPLLKDALTATLEHFFIPLTPQDLRQQTQGTLTALELAGSIALKGSYQIPVSFKPLASANLPFNFSMHVVPDATVQVAGTLSITGNFIVRSHRLSDELLHFGIYKRKGTTLTATVIASAGLEANAGGTDLLAALLKAMTPEASAPSTELPEPQAHALNAAIQDAVDHTMSISLNAACPASTVDEAALLYEIHLDATNRAETDAALAAALGGDWTLLGALPNAHSLRNILVQTHERKQTLSINLMGFFSAASVTDYMSKCTILRDDVGQLTIIDKLSASRVAADDTPGAPDPDKLRLALAQDFVTTATYAVVGSRLDLSLSISQDYLDYSASMNKARMMDNILMGSAMGLLVVDSLDTSLLRGSSFAHARVNASVRYDDAAVTSLFFADPAQQTPWTELQLQQVGRKTMQALLDPSDNTTSTRVSVLSNDAIWKEMSAKGNAGLFHSIPELSNLSLTELQVVSADWISITWWVTSLQDVATTLVQTIEVLNSAGVHPETNPEFMKQRARLASLLAKVSRETNAAFVDGWGLAVMYALSNFRGSAEMSIQWDGGSTHFQRDMEHK
jgi:hypothetical protein